MVDTVMICYQSDAPDCRHLVKTAPMFCMSPKRNLCDIDPSHPVECPFYESGEMTIEQLHYQLREYVEEAVTELKEHNEVTLYRAFSYGFFYLNIITVVIVAIVLWSAS